MSSINLSNRALRDLRRIGKGPERQRIARALDALATGAANLDIKALEGRAPWRRLRVGEYRVLLRPDDGGWLVERIVGRGDLNRAVGSL